MIRSPRLPVVCDVPISLGSSDHRLGLVSVLCVLQKAAVRGAENDNLDIYLTVPDMRTLARRSGLLSHEPGHGMTTTLHRLE